MTRQRRALPAGDYAAIIEERIVAVVERKTLENFSTSLIDGSLSLAMSELAAMPRASIAIEGSYTALLQHPYTRRGLIPDLIARLAIRYANVAINFLQSRQAAEEWTYRYLIAAYRDPDPVQLEM